jgi:hypothetical protein
LLALALAESPELCNLFPVKPSVELRHTLTLVFLVHLLELATGSSSVENGAHNALDRLHPAGSVRTRYDEFPAESSRCGLPEASLDR